MAKSTKPATAKPRARKTASAPKKPRAAAPAPVAPIEGPVEGGVLKMKDLLDRVSARTGANKKQAKGFVEAVLHELGASLARSEGFVLPPLGRAKVSRSSDDEAGHKLVIKLKRGGGKRDAAQKEPETPLAPVEE